MYTGSIIFYILSGLMFVIILGLLAENKNYKKIFKSISIFLPVLASLSVIAYLIYTIIITKGYSNNNNVIDAGMSIFGLLASVWIGLNIYNVIEKKELEDLINRNNRMQKDNDEFKIKVQNIINDNEKKYDELKNDYQAFINSSEKGFKAMVLKELFYEAQMDFMNGFLYYNKVRREFDECIDFLKQINDEKGINEVTSSYTNHTLESTLDISEFIIGPEMKSEYNERDIQKLLDYAYAYEHVIEKADYFIKRKSDEINQMLVYSLSNFMNIKIVIKKWIDYNRDNNDKEIIRNIQILETIIKIVEKAREKHEIYVKNI